MISSHGALDPTKMCASGFSVGSSLSEPYATWTRGPTTESNSDPQTHSACGSRLIAPDEQRVRALDEAELLAAIPPNGLNVEPVLARQLEQ
jgi:hypothetical protein